MSDPISRTSQFQDFLPSNVLADLIYTPLFAGAAAVSLASLPAIPYNNLLTTICIQNPTLSQLRISAHDIIKREGFWSFRRNNRGLMKCSSPVLAGQYFYGACLLDCYESFRKRFLEQDLRSNSGKHRTKNTLYEIFFSALGAEFYAIFVLAPFEVAYAMMMMNMSNFPKTLGSVFKELVSNPKQYRFPFGPVKPLIISRLPQTAFSFVLFEIFAAMFSASLVKRLHEEARTKHSQISSSSDGRNAEIMARSSGRNNSTRPKHSSTLNWSLPPPSRASQLNISFSAGVAAGVCTKIILHPLEQYQLFSAKIENQFQFVSNSRAKDLALDGLGAEDAHFFRNQQYFREFGDGRPTFGQKFALWMKTQGSNPRLLWQGFIPKLWIGAFRGGIMWLTYDAITGKNRVSY